MSRSPGQHSKAASSAACTGIPSRPGSRSNSAAATWSACGQHLTSPSFQGGGIRVSVRGCVEACAKRHRARESWLRDAKIQEAKRRGKGQIRCEVPGCGFDFLEAYGEIGRDFAHVHHCKPLGDRTRSSRTSLSDLAIVCANCHAMIHRGGECRSLRGLLVRPGSSRATDSPRVRKEGN